MKVVNKEVPGKWVAVAIIAALLIFGWLAYKYSPTDVKQQTQQSTAKQAVSPAAPATAVPAQGVAQATPATQAPAVKQDPAPASSATAQAAIPPAAATTQSPASPPAMAANNPADVKEMKVGKLVVDEVIAKKSTTELSEVKKSTTELAEVKKARIEKARIEKVRIEKARIEKVRVEKAKIDLAEIEKAKVKEMEVELAKVKQAEIELAQIKKAKVDDMHIKKAEVDDMHIKNAEVDKMHVKQAEFDKAIINKTEKKVSGVGKACPEGTECGNRNTNPKWRFVSRNSFGGVPVIYGNINRDGGPWVQSKWYAPGKEVQVVVTNWDGRSDISSRLAAAQEEAKRTEGKIRSGQLKYNCGQNHCYVCEF